METTQTQSKNKLTRSFSQEMRLLMEVLWDLVQDSLEELFLVVFLVVAIMVVEEEEDKLMTQILSFLVLYLEEGQEAVTVEEGKDKHQEKISLEQDSLGCLEEGITIAVIAHHNTTTTTEDTTVDPLGVSVTTDLCSRTSMVLHMVLVREGMRLVRDGVTLRGMVVKMPGSHRGFLTTLGHT